MTYTLYQGDCLDILPTLAAGSVDAVICDPPYGTTACAWDSVIPLEAMWRGLKWVVKPAAAVVLFGAQPFTSALVMSNLQQFRYQWIWHKSRATGFLDANRRPLNDYEDISVFYAKQCTYNPQRFRGEANHVRVGKIQGSRQAAHYNDYTRVVATESTDKFPGRVLEFDSLDPAQQVHNTQKPVDLMRYLVRTYTNPGDTVLDFTMGSGTTGVACRMEVRNFIGIELDARYYRIAERRIANAQPPLFVADAPTGSEPEQAALFAQEAHQ